MIPSGLTYIIGDENNPVQKILKLVLLASTSLWHLDSKVTYKIGSTRGLSHTGYKHRNIWSVHSTLLSLLVCLASGIASALEVKSVGEAVKTGKQAMGNIRKEGNESSYLTTIHDKDIGTVRVLLKAHSET